MCTADSLIKAVTDKGLSYSSLNLLGQMHRLRQLILRSYRIDFKEPFPSVYGFSSILYNCMTVR